MRAALSSPASTAALLQRALPAGSEMGAVEGPADRATRDSRASGKTLAAFLLARVPACAGACPRAGAALARGARPNTDILIIPWRWSTFCRSDANRVSHIRLALG